MILFQAMALLSPIPCICRGSKVYHDACLGSGWAWPTLTQTKLVIEKMSAVIEPDSLTALQKYEPQGDGHEPRKRYASLVRSQLIDVNPAITEADRLWLTQTIGDPDDFSVMVRARCPVCKYGSNKCGRCLGAGEVEALSLNEVTRACTAYADFAALVFDPGGNPEYRPSIYVKGSRIKWALLLAYDSAHERMGSNKRAYPGT